jgi:hypothetical protein
MSSDWKNRMDDDIADTFEKIKDIINLEKEGYATESIATKICKVLENPKAGTYEGIINILITAKSLHETAKTANKIIDNYYLSPMTKRRLRMKNEELIAKITRKDMSKVKFVKENLNESNYDDHDLDWIKDDNEIESDVTETEDNDADDDVSTKEASDNLSETLVNLFQEAAENGLTFEMIQEISLNALDEVDWVEARQM